MSARKGILLAGGSGTRLYPLTHVISKQLLPIYDKPMIYYPLSVLMLAGLREILVLTTQEQQGLFKALLGDGGALGISLTYQVQPRPEGIAQALILAEDYLAGAPSALILGDNVFYGQGLVPQLREELTHDEGATLFAYRVQSPERYGVVEFNDEGGVISLEEKPVRARSPWALTGLYLWDSRASALARTLLPSARGELEIVDLARLYHQRGALRALKLGRGIAWLDTGTPDALLEAATFIGALDHRQGLKVACLEEIAWRQGWISRHELLARGQSLSASDYGRYLIRLAEQEPPLPAEQPTIDRSPARS